MIELKLINEEDYRLDDISNIIFEDEYSFSFAKLEVANRSFKFGWNSKGVNPEMKIIEECSILFTGVDVYVFGYDYRKSRVAFFLNTTTNFKWFDAIPNGIAIVTETGVILVNLTSHCTLRNCIFFGDIIVDTKIEKDEMRVSFLSDDDKIISI